MIQLQWRRETRNDKSTADARDEEITMYFFAVVSISLNDLQAKAERLQMGAQQL